MKKIWTVFMYAAIAATFAGCGSDSSSSSNPPAIEEPPPVTSVSSFVVTDTAGEPVVGAKVYAIPAADVAALAQVVLDRSAENFGEYSADALKVDEPLEDLINGNYIPEGGGVETYLVIETDEDGKAAIPAGVDEEKEFFIYVQPAVDDDAHLPGGSLCREAGTIALLENADIEITVSTKPTAAATHVGTSTCLGCHPEQQGMTKTAHKLGFMAPNAPSLLQDAERFDEDDAEYNTFAALGKYEAGTTIWFYDYDGTRGFDKFKTLESDPGVEATVYAKVHLSLEDGKYFAEIENVINPEDPNSGMKHEVVLTYGGGVYKQRPITVVDDSLFLVPLQFNARGTDGSDDRVRKVWRDYHMDWWVATIDATEGAETMTLTTKPAAKNSVDVACAPCHFNGFSLTEIDGFYQATGVADANGENHPVLGVKQELNIGCETCHGPGSEHVAAFGAGKAIVSPQNLTPERESMLCGQCHSRPQGNGTFKNDSPLDLNDKMMVAGTSRADFLANNTSRQDSAAKDMWADGLHSKSHHQQYTDFIQSSKYRNGSRLLTCSSCHDLHAPGSDRHQLSGASDGTLCASCHTVDSGAHQAEKTGSSLHSGGPAQCIQCHNAKTSNSGAGLTQTGNNKHGDISSHVFDVPDKTSIPMPVPFTNTCGLCHAL